jgi:hypothetical protein
MLKYLLTACAKTDESSTYRPHDYCPPCLFGQQ